MKRVSKTPQGKIPNSTYLFSDRPEEWVKHSLGMMLGLQGYNNNILFAESASKMLPKIRLLIEREKFNNVQTHKKNPYVLDPVSYKRLMQIWDKGTFIIIHRNETEELITGREVIYPLDKDIEIEMNGTKQKIPFVWETIKKCKVCGSEKYVQLSDSDLIELFPTAVEFCTSCDYQETVEVEVKPSFQEMELARDRNTSPIWREIQGTVPIRYALEDVDLVSLASDEGGFFEEFVDGRKPRYPNIDSILNSEEITSFPSKNYFESSVKFIYKEFRFYFDNLFADIVDILEFQKADQMYDSTHESIRTKIRETDDLE